ncbi:MAG: HD domain-containing protein [archaeon]|nr:HD domain-containing protein [archaeon]
MHTIKDSIHQDIEVTDFEVGLIDSPAVQRLRRIRQMGFAHLVYPCATHSRFEHSLGTMYLAGALSSNLGFDEKTRAELKVAGLLHDVGHFPFSHNSEVDNYIKEKLNLDHVDISAKLIKMYYKDAIEDAGLSQKNVVDMIRGRGKYGSILSSGIDVDKMDYLVRDAYFTGTAYGLIDLSRLLCTTGFKKTLAFHIKGIRNIEAVIISRFMMYSTVYFHRTIKIAGAMFGRAVTRAFDDGSIDVHEYIRMDDFDLVSSLRRNRSYLAECLDKRRLYKLGACLSVNDLSEKEISKCVALKSRALKDIEQDMEKRLGVARGTLIIDIAPKKTLEPIKMIDGAKLLNLEEISEFSRSVMNQEWQNWNIQFLAPQKYRKKIGGASKLFGEYV